MRLYSYVVARDYGFAPNPYHGYCTLATCKPLIRRMANVGDWVAGTGAAPNRLVGHLVFAMRIAETMSFSEYFEDPRFNLKRPNLSGSLKQAFGDNIYHRLELGEWGQLDSHHALPDGSSNPENIARDTQTDRVLISDRFGYFGSNAPKIPENVRFQGQDDLVANRGYKNKFDDQSVYDFVEWFEQLDAQGVKGRPSEWLKRGALRR